MNSITNHWPTLLVILQLLFAHHCVHISAAAAAAATTTRRHDDQLVELELWSIASDENLYYGEISVESELKLTYTFKLLLCSVCNTTWVPTAGPFSRTYAPLALPDERSWIVYNDLVAVVVVHRSGLTIGSSGKMIGAPIGVAIEVHAPQVLARHEGISGVLGLNGASHATSHGTNPLDVLYDRGRISRHVYALRLDQRAPRADLRERRPTGVLTFGGANSSLYSGEILYAPMTAMAELEADNLGWFLRAKEARLDWSRVADAAAAPASDAMASFRFHTGANQTLRLFPDTSTAYFVGYKRYLDKYLIDFMGAKRFGLAGNYAFEDCRLDNKPDFVFTLEANFEIRIKPEDYVIDYGHQNGRHYCLAAFIGHHDNDWTLGTRFLRNYYTVFDYDQARVGFATPIQAH